MNENETLQALETSLGMTVEEVRVRLTESYQRTRWNTEDYLHANDIPNGERLTVLFVETPKYRPSKDGKVGAPSWGVGVERNNEGAGLISPEDESRGRNKGRDDELAALKALVDEHGPVEVTKVQAGKGGRLYFIDPRVLNERLV